MTTLPGCLEILEDDDVVVAILSNGDAFGEEIWKQNLNTKSRYYVRALAPTDLRIIKTASLKKVLQFYHSFSESFDTNMVLRFVKKIVREILRNILREKI